MSSGNEIGSGFFSRISSETFIILRTQFILLFIDLRLDKMKIALGIKKAELTKPDWFSKHSFQHLPLQEMKIRK